MSGLQLFKQTVALMKKMSTQQVAICIALGILSSIQGILSIVGMILLFIYALHLSKNLLENTPRHDSYNGRLKNGRPLIGLAILVNLGVLGGIILFIIPGIAFSIYRSLAYAVAMYHPEKTVVQWMKHSRGLVTGRRRTTAWTLFVFGLIVGLIAIAIIIVLGVIVGLLGNAGLLGSAGLEGLLTQENELSTASIVRYIIIGALVGIITPLQYLPSLILYKHYEAHKLPVHKQSE